MRYIIYIALIIIAATFGLFTFDHLNAPAKPTDAALIVNDRTLTLDELRIRYERNPYGGTDREAFLESVITRELLIQEAQKTGIDREENFRRTVQEFFEQSLIKVLMDRKYGQFQEPLSEDEIAAYRNRMNKRLQLTLTRYPTHDAALAAGDGVKETLSEAFLDLPPLVREKILHVAPGEKSEPFAAGKDFIVVHVDTESPLATDADEEISEALLVKRIAEEKQALKMDQWVATLRHNARVSVLPKSNELGAFQ